MVKIAFLFLTINNLKQTDIWEKYFSEMSSENYNIYVHPKHPKQVTNTILKNNIISKNVENRWGFLTIALYELLYESFQNIKNTHFIFVSESCIPIQKLSLFIKYISLFNSKTSFIYFKDKTDIDDNNLKRIKENNNWEKYKPIEKHEGIGYCLSRSHAQIIINNKKNITNFYSKLNCGDEHILSILKKEKYIERQSMTFYNWDIIKIQINNIDKKINKIYTNVEKRLYKMYDLYHYKKLIDKKSIDKKSIDKKSIDKKSIKNKIKNEILNKIKNEILNKIKNKDLKEFLNKNELIKIKNLRIKKSDIGKHPYTYNYINDNELKDIQKKNYFFLRKINETGNYNNIFI